MVAINCHIFILNVQNFKLKVYKVDVYLTNNVATMHVVDRKTMFDRDTTQLFLDV